MAHFYGVVHGRTRTSVSRLGNKAGGLRVITASWQGCVEVSLYERDGMDHARVELAQWHGAGTNCVLYDGPIAGSGSAQLAESAARVRDGLPTRKGARNL